MDIEEAVRRALAATGVPYEIMDCDPELADTENFCRAYGIPPERSANTIVVAAKGGQASVPHAACVLLATTRLDVNRTVRRRMGAKKASFAGADETGAVTGMLIGGVTPFALPPGMPIYVDGRVIEQDWVVLGGGSRSCKVKVPPRVFDALAGVEVIADLASE